MNFRFLLLLVLAVGLTYAAPAQTARIAHLSHGGSLETLAAGEDNFGTPPPYFLADSIEILSDTTAREYGRWAGYRAPAEKTRVVQYSYPRRGATYAQSATYYIANEQRSHRQSQPIKVVRRDTTVAHAAPAPTLKKQKAKRKKAFLPPTVPTPPQSGVWVGIAAMVLLAGAGWLLGERRPQPA